MIKKRILQILDKKQVTKEKFFKEIGITSANFRGKALETPLNSNTIENIFAVFPDISAEWLLTGKGEMLKDNNHSDKQKEDIIYTTLPLIPIDAIAGVPAGDFQGIRFEDCEQYRIPDFESKGAEFLIRVNGSSMYPKYSNGDILACKKIEEILFIQWGKVYVIDSSQGSLVKRLFEDKENKEYLICVSDNKENYPPFSIPKSDIRSLSIVIGVIRLE